jgi:hypothetical protein
MLYKNKAGPGIFYPLRAVTGGTKVSRFDKMIVPQIVPIKPERKGGKSKTALDILSQKILTGPSKRRDKEW